MGWVPGESYAPLPLFDFFDILVCPIGVLPLVLGLYITHIMYVESQMCSRGQVSHNILSCSPPHHPTHPHCIVGPPAGISTISLHFSIFLPNHITSWISVSCVPPHSNPSSPSYFAFLAPV